MSAIWGVWRRVGDGGADGVPPALERMAGVLRFLGPDSCRQFHAGGVGMGRALRRSLPEDDFDAQPARMASGDILVATLRLDNRDELMATLALRGALADSDVLAAAWERWGEETPGHLEGEFAFAVWQPGRKRLFCARDPLGLRALYYAAKPGLFAFATLPRAIHTLPEFPRELDADEVAIRVALFSESNEVSLFRGIQKLPCGHALVVTESGEQVSRYWRLENAPEIRLRSDGDYDEAFREVLDRAVRVRLRARGPVGSMLSGGFDSSSVTASAAGLLAERGESLYAFTAVPDPAFRGAVPRERFGDESGHAAALAALYPNVRHRTVAPHDVFPLDLAREAHRRSDAPGGHLCLMPNWASMADAYREAGIGTVLSGAMGNLTISYNGLALLPSLARQWRWGRWYKESRGLIDHAHFRWPGVLALSFGPAAPAFLWRLAQRRRTGVGSGLPKYAILHRRFFEEKRIAQLAVERGIDPEYRPESDSRRMRQRILLQQGRAAARPIEVRDPTADRRLVEFCLGVPEEQYLRAGTTKYLLRRAMSGRLPPVILNEWRKGMLGADWHLRFAPYRYRFCDALEEMSQSALAAECFDLPRLRRLLEAWPADWTAPGVQSEYRMGVGRALLAGSFIRWVEKERV